jgi:hypothetical protein
VSIDDQIGSTVLIENTVTKHCPTLIGMEVEETEKEEGQEQDGRKRCKQNNTKYHSLIAALGWLYVV